VIVLDKNPFIPLKMADLVIVDGRVDEEILNNLKRLNLKIIQTTKCKEVEDSISYHPDIVIHPINNNTLLIAPNVFDYYEEKFHGLGIKIIKGEKFLHRRYPDDIAYNVGRLKGIAIHNFKYTDEKLKYYLERENLKLIDVKQGYSKCSMAIVGEMSAITSDYPIYEKLTSIGCKVLLIQPGHILLKGQNYGFIGGTTGNLSEDTIIISGSLCSHPEEKKILDFIKKNNKKVVFLSKKKIVDIGTIISLYCH
jgi:hypothetical protein